MRNNISNDDRYAVTIQRFESADKLFESFRAADKLGLYPEEFREKYLETLNFRQHVRKIRLIALESSRQAVLMAREKKSEVSLIISAVESRKDKLKRGEKRAYNKCVLMLGKISLLITEAEQNYKASLIDAELYFRSERKAAFRNHSQYFTKKICNRLKQLKAA